MGGIDVAVFALLAGWFLDRWLGDPVWLPHPVVLFGKVIARGEKLLNRGTSRIWKGGLFSILLILLVFASTNLIINCLFEIHQAAALIFSALAVFYCLAGKTLADEVRGVFVALDQSLEAGRRQVARIVGRDTSQLDPQQIRTAALETLAENLSDGVVAPLFWLAVLGVPGMLAYKMVNTLDSMIGYKNERYQQFGCWAARIDDVANYLPARLTAFMMLLVSGKWPAFSFVRKYGPAHASPNSGYPEAALAGILDCCFGGPNVYFGQVVDKPYIGDNSRQLTANDMTVAVKINQRVEVLLVVVVALLLNFHFWWRLIFRLP